jgi:hypothetical protein
VSVVIIGVNCHHHKEKAMKIKIVKSSSTGTKIESACPWVVDAPEKPRS